MKYHNGANLCKALSVMRISEKRHIPVQVVDEIHPYATTQETQAGNQLLLHEHEMFTDAICDIVGKNLT